LTLRATWLAAASAGQQKHQNGSNKASHPIISFIKAIQAGIPTVSLSN
jgi:hypothetical protein